MKYGKAVFTVILIIFIPIYSGGISVVKHFCCGTVENTEFLFGLHQGTISQDNHHANDESACCENTEQEDCCNSENDDNQCGDEILTFDSNDSWLISPMTSWDTIVDIVVLSIFYVFDLQKNTTFLTSEFVESDIPPDKELAHTIQILRL